ncbi:BTB/POZ domain protein [Quillaja saponaria]|uniref:BTB/POZ domain protein n=1 Tax=Quillaja saponaria TaxID=32244 RepID=A0AAD7KNK5_QUISA|nr:BTB/POZ domain protein [Quillaja saponaria]
MFTVNAASKTLVSVASQSKSGRNNKLKTGEHLRFLIMLMTWTALWVLKILTLVNQIPATSPKYQSVMAMANKFMEENAKDGHVELVDINRTVLASAFERTLNLLHCTLQHTQIDRGDSDMSKYAWTTRLIQANPMGSYLVSCVKRIIFCLEVVVHALSDSDKGIRQVQVASSISDREKDEDVMAEKLAQELLWITYKLRDYGAICEALVQWSFASGLASLSLTTHTRVQGLILKITGFLSL